jgi:seryl-tRNA synthetase
MRYLVEPGTGCAIIQLRREGLRLRGEMRSLAGIVKAAKKPYPKLYRQHNEVCKKRKALRDEAKKKSREEYYDTMPKIEVDKQIDQLLNKQNKDLSDAEDDHEDWNPPIPICTAFDNSKYNVFRHSGYPRGFI